MYFLYKTKTNHIISTRPLGQVKHEGWELIEVFKTFDQFALVKERRYKDVDFDVDEKQRKVRKVRVRVPYDKNMARIARLQRYKRHNWTYANIGRWKRGPRGKEREGAQKIKTTTPNSFKWIVLPDGSSTRMWLPKDVDVQDILPLGWLNTRSQAYSESRKRTERRCKEIDAIVQEYIGYLLRGEEWPYS